MRSIPPSSRSPSACSMATSTPAGYPDYTGIVGAVASYWDEVTGDQMVRGIVGWGGKGVRGDTERNATRAPGRHPRGHREHRVAPPSSSSWIGRCRRLRRWAWSVRTATSRRSARARSSAPSAACACCEAEQMPLYDYRCTVMRPRGRGHARHRRQWSTACEACGGAMRKALSTPAIHFKGSGWAKKDAAASAKKASLKSGPSTSSPASEKGAGDGARTDGADKPAAASSEATTSDTAASPAGTKAD